MNMFNCVIINVISIVVINSS